MSAVSASSGLWQAEAGSERAHHTISVISARRPLPIAQLLTTSAQQLTSLRSRVCEAAIVKRLRRGAAWLYISERTVHINALQRGHGALDPGHC